MEKIDNSYYRMNAELRMLMFVVERACGLEWGNGYVFREEKKLREVVVVKQIFTHIAVVWLKYTYEQVRDWMGYKYKSSVTHAIRQVDNLIRYDVAYRNRVYNIALECGITPLVNHIIKVWDK